MAKQLAKKHHHMGELRLIAGKWRSRKISFPSVAGLRPSPSRIRETLFSWLNNDLPGSRCLDLFAGSGALGFEALSRGAESVTMVELNRQVIAALKQNRDLLNADNLQLLNRDASDINSIDGSFDIVFCDPPFNQQFIQPLINELQKSTLLTNTAKVYIETEKNLTDLNLPEPCLRCMR